MSDLNSVLKSIYRNARQFHRNGGKITITNEQWNIILSIVGTQLAFKYGSISEDGKKIKKGDNSIFVCNELIICIDTALKKLIDPKNKIQEHALASWFRKVCNRTVTDYFRSCKQNGFAGALHRYLNKENQWICLHEKSKSFFRDWWGGKEWEGKENISKCYYDSLYGHFTPAPFWEVITEELKTEGDICRRYTLYLLELQHCKYLMFKPILEIISAELQTLQVIHIKNNEQDSEKNSEEDILSSMIKPDKSCFDEVILLDDIKKTIPDFRDRFLLFECFSGYNPDHAAKESGIIEKIPHFQKMGFNRFNKTWAYNRFNELKKILRELEYDSLAARDCIAEVLLPEFEV